jgi:hypothetical protein
MIVYIGITCYYGQWHFTYGKSYEVTKSTVRKDFIKDDYGKAYFPHLSPELFTTIEEFRDNKLNIILN